MNALLDSVHGLLARARDDLFVVRQLAQVPSAPGWAIGFHTQQAVEKSLKAALTLAGIAFPRTHNLVMLVELLRAAHWCVPPDADDFYRLVPYGVALRYDDLPTAVPLDVSPQSLVDVAQRTVVWAQEQISKQS